MSTLTVPQAREMLSITDGISEVTHPYEGGSHEFVYESDGAGSHAVFLDLGGHRYSVDRPALESALSRIPGGGEAMADRWPLNLVMEPLNWFWDRKAGDFKMLALDDDVISFTKPTAILFDPKRVLDVMAETMEEHNEHAGNVEVVNFTHSIEETSFALRSHGSFVDARPGDRTLGGFYFAGSLLGRRRIEAAVYTDRVACSNGMVSPDGVARFSTGNSDEGSEGSLDRFYAWVGEQVADLYGGEALRREFARLEHLTTHAVTEHTGSVLHDVFARFRVPTEMRTYIHEALAEEGDGTMYGVVQAMTRAAQHNPHLTVAQRHDLMHMAGGVTAIAQDVCTSCRRPMND